MNKKHLIVFVSKLQNCRIELADAYMMSKKTAPEYESVIANALFAISAMKADLIKEYNLCQNKIIDNVLQSQSTKL